MIHWRRFLQNSFLKKLMAQTYLTQNSSESIYSYKNRTHQLQIMRITNIPNWYYERIVFPNRYLLFHAPTGAKLEIHDGKPITAVIEDTIDCASLKLRPLSRRI